MARSRTTKGPFFTASAALLTAFVVASVHPALGQDQLAAAESAAKAGAETADGKMFEDAAPIELFDADLRVEPERGDGGQPDRHATIVSTMPLNRATRSQFKS